MSAELPSTEQIFTETSRLVPLIHRDPQYIPIICVWKSPMLLEIVTLLKKKTIPFYDSSIEGTAISSFLLCYAVLRH